MEALKGKYFGMTDVQEILKGEEYIATAKLYWGRSPLPDGAEIVGGYSDVGRAGALIRLANGSYVCGNDGAFSSVILEKGKKKMLTLDDFIKLDDVENNLLNNETMYMNQETGSVDSGENWKTDFLATRLYDIFELWSGEDDDGSGGLTEVEKNKDGEWVET